MIEYISGETTLKKNGGISLFALDELREKASRIKECKIKSLIKS